MADFKLIKTKLEDNNAIGVLTLNAPPVNALSITLLKEIQAALDEFQKAKVRAVVVTAAGNNAFCAGADVKEMASLEKDPAKAGEFLGLGNEVFNKIENFNAPVIAAINNLTLGGGLELALACDVRISSDRARFGLPEVSLGLIPAWGGIARLPRLIGVGRAKELIFTGQLVNAQEAKTLGILNKVVPDGDELRAAMDIAKRISVKSSPVAVAAAKRAINAGMGETIDVALAASEKEMGEVMTSEDLREGIKAFTEKRQPSFKGQ
ncbi:MAG TPA: enoyl-CoA hydratase-related protein [Candidatus Thermoplasmatota archaeon]|nr:enoyl-CoA hydratase-related protein [Candidatus Thermoplasmatota archaeon]